jgi:hypothetical protein
LHLSALVARASWIAQRDGSVATAFSIQAFQIGGKDFFAAAGRQASAVAV